MSNVSTLRPTKRVTVNAHRVEFSMIPFGVIEAVFHAALAVAWAADDGDLSADGQDAEERLAALQKVISTASQYTVPVQIEVDEPISLMGETS